MPSIRPTPLESACLQHSIHAIKFDINFARIERTNVPVPRIIRVGTAKFLCFEKKRTRATMQPSQRRLT